MNNQQFERLVHNLQDVMRCPHCSSSYIMEDIHYLGQLDSMTFLHMKCGKCNTPVFASVSLDDKDGGMKVEDITADDIALTDTPLTDTLSPVDASMELSDIGFEQKELEQIQDISPMQDIAIEDIPAEKLMNSLAPITYDNVLDMHSFLDGFDGDFEKSLK